MAVVSHPNELPSELTSFVGRVEELLEIRRLLTASRLVTLTGVGGVGKSRLALRAAAGMRRSYRDGARLVELAELTDESLLPEAVAAALGLADQSDRDMIPLLCDFLADRRLLLVLDNCEHLTGACARLLARLLQAAPGLKVLATSREVLHVPGEQVYPVAPLPVPETDHPTAATDVSRFPGLALLAERAAAARHGFSPTEDNVAELAYISRRLDGIPLAVELAAARLRSLSVDQLAAGLNDRFRLLNRGSNVGLRRHQTLRAAMDWSFQLSSRSERTLWVRASILVGRFDIEALQAVCAGGGLAPDALVDALTGLVDKSVLTAEDGSGHHHYRMLDTVRQYGLDQLRHPGDDDWGVDETRLRRLHLDYCLRLAERFNEDWFGPRQPSWSRRMRAALPTFRQALEHCLGTGQNRVALRLVGLLDSFWYGGTVAREGRVWLERALAADTEPTIDRVRALTVYGRLLAAGGLTSEAVQPVTECLEIARELDDPTALTDALAGRALNLVQHQPSGAELGQPALAQAVLFLDESIERATRENRPFAVAVATHFRGLAAMAAGDLPEAGRQLAACRAWCRARGDQWWLSHVLANSVPVALMTGDAAQAAEFGRESVRGSFAVNDLLGLTISLEVLAWAASAASEHHRAARLWGASARQAHANGGNPYDSGVFLPVRQGFMAATRAALGDRGFDEEHRRGVDLSIEDAVSYAVGEDRPDERPGGAAADDPIGLTPREREVAALVTQGLSNKEIAARLRIAQRTAESHIEHILAKLSFTSRTQLAVWHVAQRL